MKQIRANIAENKKVARDFYKMRIESAYLAKCSKPGQFVEVKCSEGFGPLLRRPLGVHRISKGGVEILYEVVGKGTELLSRKKSGETIDIIGPLGNGFTLPRTTNDERRTTILVAGGVGVAPLTALADALRKKKTKVVVIIGAKTGSHILCENELKSLGCMVKVATEDGSKGHKGFATDLLRITRYEQRDTIYTCGPHPMLEAVSHIADSSGVPCQVSMEERMACGVGVCLGCPVKVKGQGYKMVCKDGPVFDAKEIVW